MISDHCQAISALPRRCVRADICMIITISVQQHIHAKVHYTLSSVHLSVTWVDQSKTVEVRIMQLSPQSDCSFPVVNFTMKFRRKQGVGCGIREE